MALKSEEITEIGKHFSPQAQIVTNLPDPKTVKDLSAVFVKTKKGYSKYRMINGEYHLETELTKV